MKQKHLAVALSAIFAAAALTGCGSDSENSYNNGGTPPVVTPPVVTPPTDGGETPPVVTPPTDGGETPPVVTPPTDGGETPPVTGEGSTGIGGAETGQVGKTDSGQVVAGVQTIRGATSNFDKLRNPDAAKNAAATLLADLPLQNKKMTNIVVGAEVATDTNGSKIVTKRYIGEDAPAGQENPNNADSLQTENVKNVDINNGLFDANGMNNGLVNINVNKVNNQDGPGSTYVTTVAGQEALQKTTSRFFGAYSTNAEDQNTVLNNSHSFKIRDAEGKKVNLAGIAATDSTAEAPNFTLQSDKIKLDHVQYGRVSANIEPLTKGQIDSLTVQNGNSYYGSDFLAKGEPLATDVYFFRGLNETKATGEKGMPTTGKVEYAGHALMYGIDNSYHGKGSEGESNSFTRGTEGEGLGNFVQAAVDFDTRTVGGSVYNVWLTDKTKNEVVEDTLVKFNGAIGESNSFSGTAVRDYIKDDTAASFHGSFFGDNASEMGGSFNSVTDGQKFGQAGWGGVFGAQALNKAPVNPPSDNGNGGIGQ